LILLFPQVAKRAQEQRLRALLAHEERKTDFTVGPDRRLPIFEDTEHRERLAEDKPWLEIDRDERLRALPVYAPDRREEARLLVQDRQLARAAACCDRLAEVPVEEIGILSRT
jgi:hypothetical protein